METASGKLVAGKGGRIWPRTSLAISEERMRIDRWREVDQHAPIVTSHVDRKWERCSPQERKSTGSDMRSSI